MCSPGRLGCPSGHFLHESCCYAMSKDGEQGRLIFLIHRACSNSASMVLSMHTWWCLWKEYKQRSCKDRTSKCWLVALKAYIASMKIQKSRVLPCTCCHNSMLTVVSYFVALNSVANPAMQSLHSGVKTGWHKHEHGNGRNNRTKKLISLWVLRNVGAGGRIESAGIDVPSHATKNHVVLSPSSRAYDAKN